MEAAEIAEEELAACLALSANDLGRLYRSLLGDIYDEGDDWRAEAEAAS